MTNKIKYTYSTEMDIIFDNDLTYYFKGSIDEATKIVESLVNLYNFNHFLAIESETGEILFEG